MASVQIFNYHIYAPSRAPDARLDQVLGMLQSQVKVQTLMSESLKTLQASQSKVDGQMESAVKAMTDAGTMLQTLAGRIASAGTDPAALKAISDDLNTHGQTLSTATEALNSAVTAQSQAVEAVQSLPETGSLQPDQGAGSTSGGAGGGTLEADKSAAVI